MSAFFFLWDFLEKSQTLFSNNAHIIITHKFCVSYANVYAYERISRFTFSPNIFLFCPHPKSKTHTLLYALHSHYCWQRASWDLLVFPSQLFFLSCPLDLIILKLVLFSEFSSILTTHFVIYTSSTSEPFSLFILQHFYEANCVKNSCTL